MMTYGIVIVGQNPHAESDYAKLIGPNVMCGMRSTGWGGTEQLRRWRRQGTNYMLTVALGLAVGRRTGGLRAHQPLGRGGQGARQGGGVV
jgi:hypothetical protein